MRDSRKRRKGRRRNRTVRDRDRGSEPTTEKVKVGKRRVRKIKRKNANHTRGSDSKCGYCIPVAIAMERLNFKILQNS